MKQKLSMPLIISAIIFILLALPAHLVMATNSDIDFALEEPITGSVYSGIANIRGWAVALTGISRVELLIDGVAYSNIPMGGRRKDVGASYPSYPDADQSGFSMAFNYSNLTAGSHTFTVRAIDKSGNIKETIASFSIARFETSFIADPARVSISDAKIAREDSKRISIDDLTADGKKYHAHLEWGAATQGFRITQINLTGTTSSTTVSPNQKKSLPHVVGDDLSEESNPPIKPTAASDVSFKLEEPITGSVYSGIANIRGWAVALTGISRVELLIDGVAYSNIPMGGRRKDVGASYPSYPDADQSGFSMTFNYSNLTAGSHTFTVRAIDKSGNINETLTSFTITRFENSFISNLDSISLANAQITHDNNSIIIKNMAADGKQYDVTLQWNSAMQGFAITQINRTGSAPANRAPVASPLSIQSNPAIPLVQLNLIGTDPDNDTLTFMLQSPSVGAGYSEAYVTPQSGRLYVTLDGSGTSFDLSYRVSDGLLYSEPAKVTIAVTADTQKKGTGLEAVDPQVYGGIPLNNPYGDLYGAPGDAPSLPKAIDLSANFPIPGDQGLQGSCVAWATTYALKSYQERVEIGWTLDRQDHLFSPAFVYNQLNTDKTCQTGTQIYDALKLLQDQGAATLDTMSYTDHICTERPSDTALQQAANFKIRSWGKLSTIEGMKAELANYRPVVIAIPVYDSFQQLKGANSVYNTITGNYYGRHAVTMVGYDDNRYGGAFKVINSWGTTRGDNGYFWLTYDFARQAIIQEAYSAQDAENATNPSPVDPRPQPPSLPNLQVTSWESNYDNKPGGSGQLQWRVVNVGTANAPAGAYVALVLSSNPKITSANAIFVIYDQIPFEIKAGEGAFRDSNNAINFRFPDTLAPGAYYMAVWVDPQNTVPESNENDNISLGGNQVVIENTLPDLMIETWYAEWDSGGNGSFIYKVVNQGKSDAPPGWDINLMISPDSRLDDDNNYYLFYETIPFAVTASNFVYRDQSNPAHFNLNVSQKGNRIPAGVYYMAVWANDLDTIEEANQRNNISWGQSPIRIGAGTQTQAMDESAETGFRQFNGKVAPPADLLMRKVEISATPDGGRQLKLLDKGPQIGTQNEPLMLKTVKSRDIGVFPTTKEWPMPR